MSPIESIAQAIELSDDARVITVAEPPYRIVHTNKAWYDVTGYKFTEIAGFTSSFLQGPDTDRETERDLVASLSSGKHTKVRLLNYTKDGEPFFNVIECFPLKDKQGQLTHFCGVLQSEPAGEGFARRLEAPPALVQMQAAAAAAAKADADGCMLPLIDLPMPGGLSCGEDEEGISRRSTAEAPPKRPRRQRGNSVRMAEALNNTTDAVVMTQPFPPYSITHVNRPWCVMCGYTQEEVEGHPNSILQGPETDQAILKDLMMSVQRGEPTSATLVNYKKGGEKFVNQVTVTPVYNEGDELEQFMAILNEVDAPGPSS